MASGKGETWLVSANGGNPRRLVASPGGAFAPSWSTDGRLIRFISNRGGTTRVWEIPVRGGDPVLLTRGGSYDSLESPDGSIPLRRSLVTRHPPHPACAPVAGRHTGEPERRVDPRNTAGIRPSLLDAGPRWHFLRGRQQRPALLKFVSLDSRKVTVLAALPKPPAKFTKGLSISPDGRYALYCQDDLDRYEIRVVANFR